MKKHLPLLLALLFHFQNLCAQIMERSLSAGAFSEIHLLSPYGADAWLIGGHGEPELGAYFQDTLFVAVVSFDGEIRLRKNLSTPVEEVQYWRDLLALPDGGILVTFESTLCDVAGYILTVQRLDAKGALMWEKKGNFSLGLPRPPEQWFVGPDGHLLGAAYNEIWKVDHLTGNILWKASLEGVDNGTYNPSTFALISGTEDFIALGSPDLQRWEKTGSPTLPKYVLEKSKELSGYYRRLFLGGDGWFYFDQHHPNLTLERVNSDLQHEVLPLDFEGLAGVAVTEQGIFVLDMLSVNTPRLRRFDLQGQNGVVVMMPEPWYQPWYFNSISKNNGQVCIFGREKLGFSGVVNPRWNSAAWLRSFPETTPGGVSALPDAAITAVEQSYSIDTMSVSVFPANVAYNLFGGGYKLRVSNLGSQMIEQVYVNTTFQYNYFWDICSNIPAKQRLFPKLNLAPGESTWIEFGDIKADGQLMLPTEICFWTSSPNQLTDSNHDNDRYCHPASYTVAVGDPPAPAFSLAPNPSDVFARITFLENYEASSWQIFDAAGRLAASGPCPDGSLSLELNTSHLLDGFYFVRVGNRAAKLVVRH